MNITYLGHSCFYLENGDDKIVIDPFYDASKFDISPNYIVLTHLHQDHLGNAPALWANAKVIGTFELCNYLSAQGAGDVMPMHIGGYISVGGFKVKFVPAMHSSSADGVVSNGVATGVVINIGGKVIYHCGDTGLFGDMELIGKRNKVDIAMIPIGGHFTMDIDDAIFAAELIKPKVAIPMHYNTFDVIEADPNGFVSKLPPSVKGFIFDIGQKVGVDALL